MEADSALRLALEERSRGKTLEVSELGCEAVDGHLEVLVLAVRPHHGFDDLGHGRNRLAFPDADGSGVILGGCVNG